jgi:hypothetical protein
MEATVITCLAVGWQHVVSGLPFCWRTCAVDYGSRSPHAVSPVVNFKCSDLSVCVGIWFHAFRVLALITSFIQDLGNPKSAVFCSFHNSVTICSLVTKFYILCAPFLNVFTIYRFNWVQSTSRKFGLCRVINVANLSVLTARRRPRLASDCCTHIFM